MNERTNDIEIMKQRMDRETKRAERGIGHKPANGSEPRQVCPQKRDSTAWLHA